MGEGRQQGGEAVLMRRIGFPVAMLILSMSRVSADEASDYIAAAGKENTAFADCMIRHTKPFVQSTEAPEDLADKAMKSCGTEIDSLRRALKNPPANLSDVRAQEVTKEVVANLRETIIEEIKKMRQE
jgi:hypothetical protein